MARVILVRVGGTDECPMYSPEDADDLKALNGQNTIVCDVKGERSKRTTLQNRSIHKYCGLLAKKFNDGGLDMATVLKEKEVEVSWSMEGVKDVIWRPIQLALFPDKASTTQLETGDVSRVYEQLAKIMVTKFNINQSFPNRHGD